MKRQLLKRICCVTLLLVFIFQSAYSQQPVGVGIDLAKTYPSPDVASLGSYGLSSPIVFNGQVNVNVPLYTVSYKELAVPLSLSYNTGGLKVDDHPGMMGLGWSLNAGGLIYRKVNGIYDEHPKEFPNNNTYADEKCYYYNCGRVAANFTNVDSIKKYALDDVSPEEAIENIYDAAPDEFIFNFGDYSGTFYFTRAYHGAPLEIKFKPNGAYHLKAEIVEIRDFIYFDDYIYESSFQSRQAKRSIYTIRITDDQGVQYLFGGDQKAIEFSNNGNLNEKVYNIASAWHLTEILSPNGYKIQFTYKKKGRVFTQVKQRNTVLYHETTNFGGYGQALIVFDFYYGSNEVYHNGTADKISISIQNPSYLDSIKSPAQNIVFSTSATEELNYDLDWTHGLVENSSDLSETQTARRTSTWQKLDEINIVGFKKIEFSYRDQSDKRLRLDSIEFSNTHSLTKELYKFRYDALSLPAYNSQKADHWGYFNNSAYAYDTNYLVTRAPNASYMQAEMLQEITYPTGGTTLYEYEPHDYKKVVSQLPFSVYDTSSNIIAGGLRIKKITSKSGAGMASLTKEFFYLKDYVTSGTSSSGVLAGKPQYVNFGTKRSAFNNTDNFWSGSWASSVMYYAKIVDNNYLPIGTTNGNYITYSEVTEKSNNGYTVHKFSNHDNGYGDKAPYKVHTNFTSKFQEEAFISLETMRGLELSTEMYDSLKRKIKKTNYEYFIDTSAEYKVPFFSRIYEVDRGLKRVSTGAHFIKPVLLRSIKDTNYVVPSGNYLTTSTEYKYYPDVVSGTPAQDNYKERKVEVLNSKSETLRTTFKYPEEFSATSPYSAMIDRNMVSPIIEQIDSNITAGNKELLRIKTNYQYWHANTLILPTTFQKSLSGNTLETQSTVLDYDTKGCVLETSDIKAVPITYIWDYNFMYPIAQIKNADTSSVAATSFEADSKGGLSYSGAINGTYSFTGNNSYLSSNGNITKSGLPSMTYIVSYWGRNVSGSGSGSVNVNSAGPTRTGKTIGLWTYYEHELTTTSITISGSNYIDELRIYPKVGFMKTFTYRPLVGMTSETDENNKTIFYEYDFFGRLNVIRDEDGKILKQVGYKFKGSTTE